jgi:hypothetical protein
VLLFTCKILLTNEIKTQKFKNEMFFERFNQQKVKKTKFLNLVLVCSQKYNSMIEDLCLIFGS